MSRDKRGSSDNTVREYQLRWLHMGPTKGIETESPRLGEENQDSGGGG